MLPKTFPPAQPSIRGVPPTEQVSSAHVPGRKTTCATLRKDHQFSQENMSCLRTPRCLPPLARPVRSPEPLAAGSETGPTPCAAGSETGPTPCPASSVTGRTRCNSVARVRSGREPGPACANQESVASRGATLFLPQLPKHLPKAIGLLRARVAHAVWFLPYSSPVLRRRRSVLSDLICFRGRRPQGRFRRRIRA